MLRRGEVFGFGWVGFRVGKMYKLLFVFFFLKGFLLFIYLEVVYGGYCFLKFVGDFYGDVLEKVGLNWIKRR